MATTVLLGVALALAACSELEDDNPLELPPGPALTWIDADPAWSPDGLRLAFTRGSTRVGADDFNLRLVDVRTGRERELTRGAGHRDRHPAWSPDGRRIAFERSYNAGFCIGDEKIHVIGADGAGMRQLGSGCEPRWSPDGSRIAFIGPYSSSLVVAAAAGGPQRRIDATDIGWTFSWSPDGSQIVYERWNDDDPAIWVVDLRRGPPRVLLRSARAPLWSPDGTLILFNRPDGLWVVRPDGANARRLAHGDTDSYAWSPDAARVAFGTSREDDDGFYGDYDLFVVDRDGRNERPLNVPAHESFGGWAPDGKRLALGGSTAGYAHPQAYPVVVVAVDSSRATRATQRAAP